MSVGFAWVALGLYGFFILVGLVLCMWGTIQIPRFDRPPLYKLGVMLLCWVTTCLYIGQLLVDLPPYVSVILIEYLSPA